MPAKKKVIRRKVAKKRPNPRPNPRPKPPGSAGGKCDEKKLCAYMDKLYEYLNADQPGTLYRYLKEMSAALCNVEDQAFSGSGNPAKRWCSGGGSGGSPPPKPPVW